MSKPKLFLATDHAGFERKNVLRDYLLNHSDYGYEIVDTGAFVYDQADDYPVYIARAARGVAKKPHMNKAVVFGGSGQGEAIVSNKFNGVRATVYYGYDESIVDLARQHNNTNVLSIGARFVSDDEVIRVVEKWLQLPYSQESRHQRRLDLISKLEEKRFWRRFINLTRFNNSV